MSAILVTALILLASVTAVPAWAQRRGAWPEPWSPAPQATFPFPPDTGHEPAHGSGLVLGGVAGFFATAALSRAAYEVAGGRRICGDDSCGLAAGLSTFFVAEPFLIPAGVHLANQRKGSYTTAAGMSAVIWFGGLMLGSKADVPGEYILALPVAQIAASVIIIDRTARGAHEPR